MRWGNRATEEVDKRRRQEVKYSWRLQRVATSTSRGGTALKVRQMTSGGIYEGTVDNKNRPSSRTGSKYPRQSIPHEPMSQVFPRH